MAYALGFLELGERNLYTLYYFSNKYIKFLLDKYIFLLFSSNISSNIWDLIPLANKKYIWMVYSSLLLSAKKKSQE